MIVGVPKEILPNEQRVAALPETVHEYVKMGFDVLVESGAGAGALQSNKEYEEAGATIAADAEALFSQADVILKVKQPWLNQQAGKDEVDMMREGTVLITFLHPAAPPSHETIRALAHRKITALTMDSVPRTPRAQPMDALTSMSTVTGYKAVLIAANRFPKFIPILGTAIGTIKPARFLVVGTGVVGLQAIATAKRLGGSIQAVDIREDARKEADSVGAKIGGFEVPAELAVGEGGYAKALPPEWMDKEREALGPLVEQADIVILSALVPGEVAPLLVTEEAVRRMKPGSVIVDVAIDQGGNCAVTEPGGEVVREGVCVLGLWNIPGSMPVHASWLYAANLLNYVKNLFKNGPGALDLDDDIVARSLVTHQGKIVHQGTLKAMRNASAAAEKRE